ncbi:Uncharacterised protein [Stenotrophomonas maltophilia]|nr:Uncharacterised protein [Stenotrophomonas maltophilia]
MRSSIARTLPEQIAQPPANSAPTIVQPFPTFSPPFTCSRRKFGHRLQKCIGKSNVFQRVVHSVTEQGIHSLPVPVLRATTVHALPDLHYFFRRLHRMSNGQNQIKVYCRPFRAIHLAVGKATELCSRLFEALTLLCRILQLGFDKRRVVCLGSNRVTLDQAIEEDLGLQSVAVVGSRKHGIGFLSKDESTLDSWAKNGGENCKYRAHCRPRIPPNDAVSNAWLHAWADSIPQLLPTRHSLIPLWIRRHSDMPLQRAEHAHG